MQCSYPEVTSWHELNLLTISLYWALICEIHPSARNLNMKELYLINYRYLTTHDMLFEVEKNKFCFSDLVFMLVNINIMVFLDVMQCVLVDMSQYFRGPYFPACMASHLTRLQS
jgi:hypothetical protein